VLFADRLVWLMGRDYILEPGGADRREQLQAMRPDLSCRIVSENGFERRTGLDEYCGIVGNPVNGSACRPALDSLPYSMIAPLVVKQTDLAALLPRRLAELYAQYLRLDVIEPAGNVVTEAIQIAAVRHPDYGRRAPVAWFCGLLAEVAEALNNDDESAASPENRRCGKSLSAFEEKCTGEQPHAVPR
jgi:DNA-binding transcriptional LysR family regulator